MEVDISTDPSGLLSEQQEQQTQPHEQILQQQSSFASEIATQELDLSQIEQQGFPEPTNATNTLSTSIIEERYSNFPVSLSLENDNDNDMDEDVKDKITNTTVATTTTTTPDVQSSSQTSITSQQSTSNINRKRNTLIIFYFILFFFL